MAATKKTNKKLWALATKIAAQLFRSGVGETAARLVLESQDKRDLGGWGLNSVVCVIYQALENAEPIAPVSRKGMG